VTKEGLVLATKIIAELKDLSSLVDRAVQGWEKAIKNADDYYLDGVALNLHGFYSGLERIFERIASCIDNAFPSGPNWHYELLNQISIEIPGIRPSVLSAELQERLEEYRGFRHVVRHVYSYHLNADKIGQLVVKLPSVYTAVEAELTFFAEFLKSAD
jgi:hypothetical protein